jgi:pentose-5-phosphate-3-epimerase
MIVSIDGGIHKETIGHVRDADIFVAGSALFSKESLEIKSRGPFYKKSIETIRQALKYSA